jgi:hypothetical protein
MLEAAIARIAGTYALRAYLPASLAARTFRNSLRHLRGKTVASVPRLPQASWSQVLKNSPVQLAETAKSDGNVRLSELAVLALAAHATPSGSEIIEIGTFDGRTALNLAINAPPGVSIATLDLPPDQPSALAIEESERRYVDKPAPGARLRNCGGPWRPYADWVVQLRGDSATFRLVPPSWPGGVGFRRRLACLRLRAERLRNRHAAGQPGRHRAVARLRDLVGRDAGARRAGGGAPSWPGQYPGQQPGVLARTLALPCRLDRTAKTHYIHAP